jgi:thiol-disulfide isomerase/thioredoxin
MAVTRRCFLIFAILCAAWPVLSAQVEWFTNVEAAQAKARNENKFLLLNFTESDFCGQCNKMKEEIFDQPEFVAFAKENLIMLEVDFPHEKPQDAKQKQVNRQLAEVLHIDTFPTVVVLDQNGKFMAQGNYATGGARAYIADLEKVPGMKHVDLDAAVAEAEPAPGKPAAFVPIAPSAPVHYSELALKAISGSKERRMAMINNETFFVGDKAKVKLQERRVEVYCKEIREDSVLITVDGKPMELKLGKR